MELLRKSILWLSVLAIALAPRAASAGANANSTSSAVLVFPLTLVRKTDMDFGTIAQTGVGTVVLEPIANAMTTSGGVFPLGGKPTAAEFVGAAGSASVVIIRVPSAPVLIKRVGGTETMSVGTWTLDGQNKRTMAKSESFEFRVGATLTVPANQVEGSYAGTFDVTVQYP